MSRKEYFNNAAEKWDELYYTSELEVFLERFVLEFGLKKEMKILDVGTGTGILISFLLKAIGPDGSITAVDYAEKMIQKCKSKYSHHPNVTFQLQDLKQISLPSNSFDAVTCFGLFPHLENKEKALQQVSRVLKPGGKLVIAHALSREELRNHHNSVSEVAADLLPDDSEMRFLMQRNGFNRISIIDKPGYYLCKATKSTITL